MGLTLQDREALSAIDDTLAQSSEVTDADLNQLTTDQLKDLKNKLPKNSGLLAQLNNLRADVQNNSSNSSYNENEIGGSQTDSGTESNPYNNPSDVVGPQVQAFQKDLDTLKKKPKDEITDTDISALDKSLTKMKEGNNEKYAPQIQQFEEELNIIKDGNETHYIRNMLLGFGATTTYIGGYIAYRGVVKIGTKIPHVGPVSQEIYEKIDRFMKGEPQSGKGVFQSARDRKAVDMAQGASALTPNQEVMKNDQMNGLKELLGDELFEKYKKAGGTLPEEGFKKGLSDPKDTSLREYRLERDAQKQKLSKFFPIDIDRLDEWERQGKLREIAAQLPRGFGEKARNWISRQVLEKGPIENLLLQNKWINASQKWQVGSYSPQNEKGFQGLLTAMDTEKYDFGSENTVNIPKNMKSQLDVLVKNIHAESTIQLVEEERKIQEDIHNLEEEIKRLEQSGIPDEAKLQEAKRDLTKYQSINDTIKQARKEHSKAGGDVKVKEKDIKLFEAAKIELENKQQLVSDYEKTAREITTKEAEITKKESLLSPKKTSLKLQISTMENFLKSNGVQSISLFATDIADINFPAEAENHLNQLKNLTTTYNEDLKNKDTKIDIFRFNLLDNTYTSISALSAEIQDLNDEKTKLATTLSSKKTDLESKGLWDTAADKLLKTSNQLRQELDLNTQQLKVAKEELKQAEEKVRTTKEYKQKQKAKITAPMQMVTNPTNYLAGGRKEYTLKTSSEIDIEIQKSTDLKKKKAELAKKQAESAPVRVKIEGVAKASGLSDADILALKPSADGTHPKTSQDVLGKLNTIKTNTNTEFVKYQTFLDTQGMKLTIENGHIVVKEDSTGVVKFNDIAKPEKWAELIKKFKIK